jgi:hypothetical protein
MLEILILIALGKNIAAKARAKGRSGPPFVILLVVLWIGCELAGAVVAGIVSMVVFGGGEPELLVLYMGALPGAIIGALIAFGIVSALGPARPRDREDDYEGDYEDGDDYDRRSRDRY